MKGATERRPRLRDDGPPAPRLLRGYGPLAVLVVLFALMAWLAPSVTVEIAGAPEPEVTVIDRDPLRADPVEVRPGEVVEGTEGTQGTTGTRGGTRTVPAAEQRPCPDRTEQVPGDPYSPACMGFAGDNGGATTRGVTADKIIVSARILNERGFQQTLAALAGAEITDRPDDIKRTISAYAEYFNQRFQLYGRQLEVVFYNGKGSTTNELLGGGQAEAQADAIDVAQKIGAFAELNGASVPFTDALFRQKVVNFGSPYTSREYHMDRRPYVWSISTDCSIVAEAAAELYVKQLAGKPAQFAGPGLEGQPRKPAGLSPENPWYQECHEAAIREIERSGHDAGLKINYRLDINSFSNQAASVIARLKSDGVTTVLCGCDPIFPVFLSTKAAEQGYNPEWVIVGTAGTDLDLVGQLYDQSQWARAFGVSYLGEQRPLRAGLGYAAYKTVRNDEPAFAAEIIYSQMYMLAIGIQMAGPNLTPETFERGMFSYPGGTGMFGTWGFGPQNYTPTQDSRILWWDPEKVSIFNNKKGSYVESYGGRRFKPGSVPSGDPEVFR